MRRRTASYDSPSQGRCSPSATARSSGAPFSSAVSLAISIMADALSTPETSYPSLARGIAMAPDPTPTSSTLDPLGMCSDIAFAVASALPSAILFAALALTHPAMAFQYSLTMKLLSSSSLGFSALTMNVGVDVPVSLYLPGKTFSTATMSTNLSFSRRLLSYRGRSMPMLGTSSSQYFHLTWKSKWSVGSVPSSIILRMLRRMMRAFSSSRWLM